MKIQNVIDSIIDAIKAIDSRKIKNKAIVALQQVASISYNISYKIKNLSQITFSKSSKALFSIIKMCKDTSLFSVKNTIKSFKNIFTKSHKVSFAKIKKSKVKMPQLRNIKQNYEGILPKSLYGRFLMITILPIILLQAITTYTFYTRHWDSMVRNMIHSLSGEVALIVNAISNIIPEERDYVLETSKNYLDFEAYIDDSFEDNKHKSLNSQYDFLTNGLAARINNEFYVSEYDESHFKLAVKGDNYTLNLIFSNKRIANSSTYIFVMWVVGSSFVLILISVVFMRNQVRSILSLYKAAEEFGKGKISKKFKPSGAKEIRLASLAFIEMRERIKKLLNSKSEIVNNILIDLKKPLDEIYQITQSMSDKQNAAKIESDLRKINSRIESYISYASLDNDNLHKEMEYDVNLKGYISDIMQDYASEAFSVNIDIPEDLIVKIKPNYFSHAVRVFASNAKNNANYLSIRGQKTDDNFCHIFFDDNGLGVDDEHLEDVFKPFFRVDKTKVHVNPDMPSVGKNAESDISTGVGLGLTIAKNIIEKKGGRIKLSTSHLGGLKVSVTLPC